MREITLQQGYPSNLLCNTSFNQEKYVKRELMTFIDDENY